VVLKFEFLVSRGHAVPAGCPTSARQHDFSTVVIAAGYNSVVEKRVRKFNSFEEADKANASEDMKMTPEQRVNLVLELRNRRHPDAAQQRLARVYRIIKLKQG